MKKVLFLLTLLAASNVAHAAMASGSAEGQATEARACSLALNSARVEKMRTAFNKETTEEKCNCRQSKDQYNNDVWSCMAWVTWSEGN